MRVSVPIIYSHTALRGIAAMYVVVFHLLGYDTSDFSTKNALAQFFQWGRHSVDLFFILSGFILNWVYLSNTAKLNWSSYLRARVARILPLYYLTTALFIPIIIYSFLKYGYAYVGEGIKIKLVLNTLLVSGILSGAEGTINFPAWSIGVEFFCYLAVFPLLVILERRLACKSYGLVSFRYSRRHIHLVFRGLVSYTSNSDLPLALEQQSLSPWNIWIFDRVLFVFYLPEVRQLEDQASS